MISKTGLLSPIIIYFIVVVVIGIYATRFSSRGISEYFLGGRQMGRLVVFAIVMIAVALFVRKGTSFYKVKGTCFTLN